MIEVERVEPEALGVRAAAVVVRAARDAIDRRGRFSFAVSGGSTPAPMFAALAEADIDWTHVDIFQVDERVAPIGHADRNLTQLTAALLDHVPVAVHAMPVDRTPLGRAAISYAQRLPPTFDLVHLGLGSDGHTASLVPDDPVLHVADRPVAVTLPYQGRRRMTLTYPGIRRARRVLWLVSGQAKWPVLARVVAGDATLPAGRLADLRAVAITDGLVPVSHEEGPAGHRCT